MYEYHIGLTNAQRICHTVLFMVHSSVQTFEAVLMHCLVGVNCGHIWTCFPF